MTAFEDIFQFRKREEETETEVKVIKGTRNHRNTFWVQKSCYREGCVTWGIVMMEKPFLCNVWSFFWAFQRRFYKKLVNSLSWRNEFFVNNSTSVQKKKKNHWFHLWFAHSSFLWSRRVLSVSLLTLPLSLRIVFKNSCFVNCDLTTEEILLISDSVQKIKTLVFSYVHLLNWELFRQNFSTEFSHMQNVRSKFDELWICSNFLVYWTFVMLNDDFIS